MFIPIIDKLLNFILRHNNCLRMALAVKVSLDNAGDN